MYGSVERELLLYLYTGDTLGNLEVVVPMKVYKQCRHLLVIYVIIRLYILFVRSFVRSSVLVNLDYAPYPNNYK
jgi:hypothetical protein